MDPDLDWRNARALIVLASFAFWLLGFPVAFTLAGTSLLFLRCRHGFRRGSTRSNCSGVCRPLYAAL